MLQPHAGSWNHLPRALDGERCRTRTTPRFPGLPTALVVASLLGHPFCLTAQSVTGRLSEAETGSPIQGALVLLLDAEEDVRGGVLTDEEGYFSIRTVRVGRFSLRAEKIGYRTVTSPPFLLSPGQPLEIPLETVQTPIELEGISVEGKTQCIVRPDEGLRVARVWEEARKALENQEWASKGGFLRFRVARYRKELDRDGRVVREGIREMATLMGQTPIRSLPADDLLESGYVRRHESGSYDYFGPDARVLLSDPFLDTHCFHLVEDSEDADRIGLAFEPVRDRNVPDIRGTFWLDRATATLDLLEFQYTWVPWAEAQGVARGRVDFGILPSGAWVIQRWWIRMPIMVIDHTVRRFGGDGLRVDGVLEEGEEVLNVTMLGNGRIVEAIAANHPETPPPD